MAEDFYIVSNAVTMRQVAESYNFPINYKGFMKCPFHGNGVERTPSLKIYEGTKGFHCKACGVGGDAIRFVALLNEISDQEAMYELAIKFNITISTNQEIPEEVKIKANQAQKEREHQIAQLQAKNAYIQKINTLITTYRNILEKENPMSELYSYYYNKLQYQIYLLEVINEKR